MTTLVISLIRFLQVHIRKLFSDHSQPLRLPDQVTQISDSQTVYNGATEHNGQTGNIGIQASYLADDVNKVFAKVPKKISRVKMERFVTN